MNRRNGHPGATGSPGTASRRLRHRKHQGPRRPRSGPQAARPCTSARPGRPVCITWSTKSSTTRSTKRSPASAPRSTSRIHIDNSVTVVDNGRGIPVDMHESGKSAAEVVLTVLHAGGKFENSAYKVSGGLHGVGVSVVNALSETLDLEVWRNGQVVSAELRARQAAGRPQGHRHDQAPRHEGHVQAGHADLRDHRIQLRHAGAAPARARVPERRRHDHARRRARRQEPPVPLRRRHRLVREAPEQEQGRRSTRSRSTCTASKDGIDVEIALQWNDGYAEDDYSFANNINTHEGGTHLSGFRSALTRTINSLRATRTTSRRT